ncbi:MAG: hypothetical protein KJZ69_17885 [Phycisphaerales bacterium]|nr:hypothetical protein [Phycisphaerales bacterium]
MLKWTRRASIFLLLGAIVNVAVAWGCAFPSMDEILDSSSRIYGAEDASPSVDVNRIQWWRAHAPKGFARDPDHVWIASAFGYEEILYGVDARSPEEDAKEALRVRTGFPLKSMECQVWTDTTGVGVGPNRVPYPRVVRRGVFGIERRPGNGTTRVYLIPLRPTPVGFAVNSVLYGGSCWLLLGGPRSLTRWRRMCRGQCTKCGYPRGTSPVCTECGEPLPVFTSRVTSTRT